MPLVSDGCAGGTNGSLAIPVLPGLKNAPKRRGGSGARRFHGSVGAAHRPPEETMETKTHDKTGIRPSQMRRVPVQFRPGPCERSTPQAFFDALHREFEFGLDVCATPENAKCARFYNREDDGLSQSWEGVCWCNPPYGEIPRWLAKAVASAREGATVVCLLPARTDSGW